MLAVRENFVIPFEEKLSGKLPCESVRDALSEMQTRPLQETVKPGYTLSR
jgi:hypothetical protein